MRVGIDISSLIYDRGVSRYTYNLVRALIASDLIDVSLYGTSWRQRPELVTRAEALIDHGHNRKHSFVLQPWPPKLHGLAWEWGLNPLKKSLPTIDVFHSWDWSQPPDKDLPLVSTIHDLAMLKFSDTAHPEILAAHQKSWQILRERQAQIIAVSQATKRDIVELLQIPPYLITVIPEALPKEIVEVDMLMTESQAEIIGKQLELTRPFILFVGTREPRKNLLKLIEAWQPLSTDLDLIIAGSAGWDGTISNLSNPHLRFLGKVTDQQLSVLYREAEAFMYPSMYEGFGLPILEAFHYGTPVVAAKVPALMEVAGNAAEYVEPESAEAIRKGIVTLLSEDVEAQRKRLQRMQIRRQMFNWDTVATQTIAVYKQAIENFPAKT
jgi:glycosyltransferase involved in cell wall biosynthesis